MLFVRAAAVAVVLAAGAGAAQAASITTPFTTDLAFQTYLAGQGVDLSPNGSGFPNGEVAVAQARGGRPGARDYEIALHAGPNFTNNGGLAGNREWTWVDNAPVPFTLQRTGDDLQFSMGNYSATLNNARVSDINGLGLRIASAQSGVTATLSDLNLGGGLGGFSTTGPNSVALAVIQGFSGDFTLTGKLTFDWPTGSSIPDGSQASRLAFQIKALEGFAVPEPTTLALLGVGLLGLGLARRRRA